jgi:flagellar biosynthetic protein FliS
MLNAYNKYKTAAVTTNDPMRQLLFIFDEVTKLLYTTRKALAEKDFETKYKSIIKVVEVLYTLQAGIDIDSNDEGSKVMSSFYISAIHNLEMANIQYDAPEQMDDIIKAFILVRNSIDEELNKEEH